MLAGRKVGKVDIPSACFCARGYQRTIRVRRVDKLFHVVEKALYRLGPRENVGSTRKDYRITPDHWAKTTFDRMFNVSACTRGLFFVYLSAHVRVMIKGAFLQFGPVHLANKL